MEKVPLSLLDQRSIPLDNTSNNQPMPEPACWFCQKKVAQNSGIQVIAKFGNGSFPVIVHPSCVKDAP